MKLTRKELRVLIENVISESQPPLQDFKAVTAACDQLEYAIEAIDPDGWSTAQKGMAARRIQFIVADFGRKFGAKLDTLAELPKQQQQESILRDTIRMLIEVGDQGGGTIHLPTPSAVALFQHEIKGQLSDGMWENAKPFNHWKFWSKLKPVLGSPKTVAYGDCRKDSYNLASLIPIIGDRMLNIGRMGQAAAGSSDENNDAIFSAADYMPATREEFMRSKETGSWKYDHVKKYMDAVSPELADEYYQSTYGMEDLKKDLMSIKRAMKLRSLPGGKRDPAGIVGTVDPASAEFYKDM